METKPFRTLVVVPGSHTDGTALASSARELQKTVDPVWPQDSRVASLQHVPVSLNVSAHSSSDAFIACLSERYLQEALWRGQQSRESGLQRLICGSKGCTA
eukprot:1049701-Amphidinium_carterae.1